MKSLHVTSSSTKTRRHRQCPGCINLERNLYLAAQIVELGRPVVIGLNMMDIADRMGVKINIQKLEQQLGAKVVPLVGSKNIGTAQLLHAVVEVARNGEHMKNATVDYGETLNGPVERLIEKIKDNGHVDYPLRWLAVKLLEMIRMYWKNQFH